MLTMLTIRIKCRADILQLDRTFHQFTRQLTHLGKSTKHNVLPRVCGKSLRVLPSPAHNICGGNIAEVRAVPAGNYHVHVDKGCCFTWPVAGTPWSDLCLLAAVKCQVHCCNYWLD